MCKCNISRMIQLSVQHPAQNHVDSIIQEIERESAFLWQSDREIEKKFLPVFRVASGRTCSGDKRKENLYF